MALPSEPTQASMLRTWVRAFSNLVAGCLLAGCFGVALAIVNERPAVGFGPRPFTTYPELMIWAWKTYWPGGILFGLPVILSAQTMLEPGRRSRAILGAYIAILATALLVVILAIPFGWLIPLPIDLMEVPTRAQLDFCAATIGAILGLPLGIIWIWSCRHRPIDALPCG